MYEAYIKMLFYLKVFNMQGNCSLYSAAIGPILTGEMLDKLHPEIEYVSLETGKGTRVHSIKTG